MIHKVNKLLIHTLERAKGEFLMSSFVKSFLLELERIEATY